MPLIPRSRTVRAILAVALTLAAIALGFFVYLVWGGGVALSDRKMLWRMMSGGGIEAPAADVVADQLRAPPGWTVSMFATGLPSARMMAVTSAGDVILAQPRGGIVVLLEHDGDGDGSADGRRTLFTGLDRPNGVDLHDGWLYVAEATRVSRVRFDAAARKTQGSLQPDS